jgi:hypothetical protein|tara:strand:+ start:109 stop:519 length:411 start_codon:yes stop_codon:yes gene_type:complete
MELPKNFYVDKNKNNLQHLVSLGYLQQDSVNLDSEEYPVLYVNNTDEDSGVLKPKQFIETTLVKKDKYIRVEDFKATSNKYIDLYYLEVYSSAEFRAHVWADSPLEAINKWSQSTGLKDFTMVSFSKVCNKSSIIL